MLGNAHRKISRLQRGLDEIFPPETATEHDYSRLADVRGCIVELSPHLIVPEHLGPYLDLIDGAIGANLRTVLDAPPQHGKTESLLHGFVSWCCGAPGYRHAYATYNDDRTMDVCRDFRRLAFEAGLGPSSRKGLVRLNEGSQVMFTSMGGGLTGRPVDGVLAIDDPIKGAEDARSKRHRDLCGRFLSTVAITRLHPGASVIVMATRWHPDDLSGRCIATGYDHIHLPAIAEQDDVLGREPGDALWPEMRPIEFLLQQKGEMGEDFNALYQGRPRSEGMKVFQAPKFYTQLPQSSFTRAHGIDCAYTAKKSSDWSVHAEMRRYDDGRFYVPDLTRIQTTAPRFAALLKQKVGGVPGRVRWYAAGAEQGVADFIREAIPYVESPPASADKFVRAIRFSAALNAGRVVFPEGAPWLPPVLAELEEFTGNDDRHDDAIDALVAAFDCLERSHNQARPRTLDIDPRM